MLLNSFSMFKRFLALILVALLCLSFAGCKEDNVFKINQFKYIYEDEVVLSYHYTYTDDNKPLTYSVDHKNTEEANYTDTFHYNDNGDMVSMTRKYSGAEETAEYSAQKITDYKYILKDSSGNEFLTIVFDKQGFIVSFRDAIGYVLEYAFTYDEKGNPATFKRLEVLPSGSSRLIEYSIEKVNNHTLRLHATGEYANDKAYYEMDCTIIK